MSEQCATVLYGIVAMIDNGSFGTPNQGMKDIRDYVALVAEVAEVPLPASLVAVCDHGKSEPHQLWLDHEYRDDGHGQAEHASSCRCEPRMCPGPSPVAGQNQPKEPSDATTP